MATVLLVRHGRTSANSGGVLAGWTPGVSLDDTGRAQVDRLQARLAQLPIARLVASPLQRCLETAQQIVNGHDVGVESDDRLGECHYGAWTGRKIGELAKDPLWRTVQDHPSAATFPASPDYTAESLRDMQARAVAAVREIDAQVERDSGPQALWVAVSHGDVIKALVTDAMGAHLDEFQRVVVGPASLSVIRFTQRRPFVIRVNDNCGGVDDLIPAKPHDGDATPGGETDAAPED